VHLLQTAANTRQRQAALSPQLLLKLTGSCLCEQHSSCWKTRRKMLSKSAGTSRQLEQHQPGELHQLLLAHVQQLRREAARPLRAGRRRQQRLQQLREPA
jgi:hypothetical protein